MPKIDLTVTISVILAICAIVTPMITTMLSNKHQLKLKKLELEAESNKELRFYHQSIYENYLKYSMRRIHYGDAETIHNYADYYALALIYFPDDLIEIAKSVNKSIIENNQTGALLSFNSISNRIRNIIKTP